MKKVSIFSASSSKIDDRFVKAARVAANVLATHDVEVLYGGGDAGLMGAVASVFLEAGKKITGIIPEFMVKNGWAHAALPSLVVVPDMETRKQKLILETEGILALPGGPGTLEEVSQALTMKQLGMITIPIVLLNTHGYFDPLLQFFDQMIAQKFMRQEHRDMWSVISDPEKVYEALVHAPAWDISAIGIAKY